MDTPLYVKSNYTLLSSMLKTTDIIDYAIKHKLTSTVITDTNMYATMEFIKKAQANNLKPVIGLELTLNDNKFVIYAKNYNGYKTLIKLSTIMNERKLIIADLEEYHHDVICILTYSAKSLYKDFSKIYEDLYLGYTNISEKKEVRTFNSNIVFFKEALYKNKEDYKLLDFLYRIRDGKTVKDEINYDILNKELNSEVLDDANNKKIIEACNLIFPKSDLLLPIYSCPNNLDSFTYLLELSKTGLNKRLNKNVTKEYQERLLSELEVIKTMGFANYFLIVYDYIKYAKQNKILVGPGRGSAAGSLVSYSLGITDIDPIKYDLLFERFLNKERATMPDIDTDFPFDKRDEVINYVVNKYGKKQVAGIITFGTMGAKQVLRDVGRVLDIPLYKIDNLTKNLPNMTKEDLTYFYKENINFKMLIETDYQLQKLYKLAINFESFPRHTSIHAAGIVMCQKPIDEIVALDVNDAMYVTSCSMEYLEDLGLLKMDFLGLKNLTIINNIIEDIKTNRNIDINFSSIPLDDFKTLDLFANADTTGIFQFESSGMRNFLRKLRPHSFEDIFAAIALFRPGPANNIDSYIRRAHNLEKITYPDSSLEQCLKNTYGIIIYQEQIMQVARTFAGYTLAEADLLRRAMSKKKYELLKNEEKKFIQKSMANNHSLEKSKEIFELVLKFAGYGFNRSHSVAYSLIAYKMAYLKVRYEIEFFANLLTNVIGSSIKTDEYIKEAKQKGVKILKPDITISTDKYLIYNNTIYFPFSNIKLIGTVATKSIIKARINTNFIDIYDAFSKLYIEGITIKTFESLIYVDAFAKFSYNKKTLINNLDNLINYATLTKDLDPSLVIKPVIEEYEEYDQGFLLEKEKELLGFYLTYHPTTIYKNNNKDVIFINECKNNFNKVVKVLVFVEKFRVIETKNHEAMAFLTGSDETMSISFTLFPKTYNMYKDIIKKDILLVEGRVEKRFNEYQIVVNKITKLNERINNE